MKRTAAVAAGWAAATAAAVTVAWGGVSLVADQVVDPLPPVLAASDDSPSADDATPSEAASPSESATDDDGGLSGDGTPDDDTPAPGAPAVATTPSGGTATTGTPAPVASPMPTPGDDATDDDGGLSGDGTPDDDETPEATPSPTSSPSPTASPSDDPTETAEPEVRTYAMVGGNVTLRYVAPGTVTIVSAQPNQGFTMEQSGSGGHHVQVRFESEEHESRLDGWWELGHDIRDRVEERAED